MKKIMITILLFCFGSQAKVQLDKIKLPPGFSIQIYVKGVPGARSMTWGKEGALYVASKSTGRVFAVDEHKKVHVIAKGLNSPNGVAYFKGDLYIAEINRIIKLPSIDRQLTSPPAINTVFDDYPTDKHHGWKFMAIGPDELLYISQGAPCNVCEKAEPYASITTLNPSTKERKIYAKGVRNTMGFDWHPVTKELWFTDNGRDFLGEDLPPDELNRAPNRGLHFGFPYCHGDKIIDPEFGEGKNCDNYQSPVQNLGPHVAALGMKFYTAEMFPKKYKNQIFIAEHGSWNRTVPLGYRVSVVKLDEKNKSSLGYEVFAEGWLQGSRAWGRPVDVIIDKEGSLLISDDRANVIYQITYQKNK